jgi:hypothetical protein
LSVKSGVTSLEGGTGRFPFGRLPMWCRRCSEGVVSDLRIDRLRCPEISAVYRLADLLQFSFVRLKALRISPSGLLSVT